MARYPVESFPVVTSLVRERLLQARKEKVCVEHYMNSKGTDILSPDRLPKIEVSPEEVQEEVDQVLMNFVGFRSNPVPVLHHDKGIVVTTTLEVPSLAEAVRAVFGPDASYGPFLHEGWRVVGYFDKGYRHFECIYKRTP